MISGSTKSKVTIKPTDASHSSDTGSRSNNVTSPSSILAWLLISSVIIFGIGSLFHFAYDWTGIAVFKYFFPINESIWEHQKLGFYPIIVFWLASGSALKTKSKFSIGNKLAAAAVSSILCMLFVPSLYYLLLGGFGFGGGLWNLVYYFVGIFMGQLHGLLLSVNKRIPLWVSIFCVLYFIAMVLVFACFTVYPADYPIFVSPDE